MANASNFQITPCGIVLQYSEFNFRSLYLHHTCLGSNATQATVVNSNSATGLGETAVNNWMINDGPSPCATVVARAQGLHINAGNWHNTFSIVFETEIFKGSTLEVMGISVENGEWAIVGGTGQFAMATGVIFKKFHEQKCNGNIIELIVHGFCPRPVVKESMSLLTKLGPWGGNAGGDKDVTEAPRRLESITVHSGWTVDSIEFSYVDQAGQKRTAGPWGGQGGDRYTIQLASLEFIKEVSGTVGTYAGHTVIRSIKFVTSKKTYGPFGQQEGTHFTVPVHNGSVVGFFGRCGTYLNAIGVYVCPL